MTPWVRILLFANIGVFFLQGTMPALADAMVFVPYFLPRRPWSVVTYMFLHGGVMHLAFNMLSLYFFGPRVEARLGPRHFILLYFISGISGAILSMLFSPMAAIVGASGAIFGVMLAFAYYWPNEQILVWGILPVPARMLVVFTTLLSLWSARTGAGAGIAHFAHLGGYAGAYLYLKWLERARGAFKRRIDSVPPAIGRRLHKAPSIDLARVHEVNRDEVNRLLDKISAQGIASLTPQEKLFLSNFVPPDDTKIS